MAVTLGVSEKLARVREVFQIPGGIGDATLSEIRLVGDEAVFIIRVASTPWLYGIPVDLADTSREVYYGCPMESFEEWLSKLPTDLIVALGAGVTFWGARADRRDYIELRLEREWPHDRRHSMARAWPDDDPTRGWQEDNGLGRVAAVDDHVGPSDWNVNPTVSRLVLVNLFRILMVEASERGSEFLTTTCPEPELKSLGFVDEGELRRADTRLLTADAGAAEALYRAGLEMPLPRFRLRGFVIVDHDDPHATEGFRAG